MKCVKSASPYVLFLGILLVISVFGVLVDNNQNINSNDTETTVSEIKSNNYMASNHLITNN